MDAYARYPISWPATWPRTKSGQRKNSAFASRTIAKARDALLEELRLLRASNVIISTNVELRRDGLPRSGQANPSDPGVAVYFTLKKKDMVIACDHWLLVEDNMWAVVKHIEALRGIERWGVVTVEQAFAGFEALPKPMTTWWEILGVDPNASLETIQEAYRQKVKVVHPDAGGSHEAFLRVQAAFEAAQQVIGRSIKRD